MAPFLVKGGRVVDPRNATDVQVGKGPTLKPWRATVGQCGPRALTHDRGPDLVKAMLNLHSPLTPEIFSKEVWKYILYP